MNIILHFQAAFECVFIINGVFLENGENIKYDDSSAIYAVVLPLNAVYLPYTVRLVGGKVTNNRELASSVELGENNFYIKLMPRLNYVYSPNNVHLYASESAGLFPRFFRLVKEEKISQARKLMTNALSKTLDDAAIIAFLKDYTDIIENKYVGQSPKGYFFVNTEGRAVLHDIAIDEGLIDNITEVEIKKA